MQQRREWREKSGGVLEGVAEGMEATDVGEVGEAEDGAEDAGKIGASVESSLKIAAGAAGGAGAVLSVGAWLISGATAAFVAGEGTALAGVAAG